jgi:hypothetical protein
MKNLSYKYVFLKIKSGFFSPYYKSIWLLMSLVVFILTPVILKNFGNLFDQPEALKDIPVEVIQINRSHLRLLFDKTLFDIYVDDEKQENFLYLESESNESKTIKIKEKLNSGTDKSTYKDFIIYVNFIETNKIEEERFELRVTVDSLDSNKKVIEFREILDSNNNSNASNNWKVITGSENFIRNSNPNDQFSFQLNDGTFQIRKNNEEWENLFSQSVLEKSNLAPFLIVKYNFFDKIDLMTFVQFNSKAINFSESQLIEFNELKRSNSISSWFNQNDEEAVFDLENYTVTSDVEFKAQNANIVTYILIVFILIVFSVVLIHILKKVVTNQVRKIDLKINNLSRTLLIFLFIVFVIVSFAIAIILPRYYNLDFENRFLLLIYIFNYIQLFIVLSIVLLITITNKIDLKINKIDLKINKNDSKNKKNDEIYKKIDFKIPIDVLINVKDNKELTKDAKNINYNGLITPVFDMDIFKKATIKVEKNKKAKNKKAKIKNAETISKETKDIESSTFYNSIDRKLLKDELVSNFILIQHRVDKEKIAHSIQIVIELKNYDVSWLSDNARTRFNEVFIQTIKSTDLDLKGQLVHMRMVNDSYETLINSTDDNEYAKKIFLVLEIKYDNKEDFKKLYLIGKKLRDNLASLSLIPTINSFYENQLFLLSPYYEIDEIKTRLNLFNEVKFEGKEKFLMLININMHSVKKSVKITEDNKNKTIKTNENKILLSTNIKVNNDIKEIQNRTQCISLFGSSNIPLELEKDYLYNLCRETNDTIVISFKKAAAYIDRDYGDFVRSRAKILHQNLTSNDSVFDKLRFKKESGIIEDNYYAFHNINKNDKIIYTIDLIKKSTNQDSFEKEVSKKYTIVLNLNSSLTFQLYKFSQYKVFQQLNSEIQSKFDLLEQKGFINRIPKILFQFNPINISTYNTVFNHGAFTTNYINDKNGIKLGENKDNKSNVIIDMEKYDTKKNDTEGVEATNGHLVILGKSGSGKTYLMGSLIYEKSKRHRQIIILDIENEYNKMDEYLKLDKEVKLEIETSNPEVEVKDNKIIFASKLEIGSEVDIVIKFVEPSSKEEKKFKYPFVISDNNPVIYSSNFKLPRSIDITNNNSKLTPSDKYIRNDSKDRKEVLIGTEIDFYLDFIDNKISDKEFKLEIETSNPKVKVKDNKITFTSKLEIGSEVDIVIKFTDPLSEKEKKFKYPFVIVDELKKEKIKFDNNPWIYSSNFQLPQSIDIINNNSESNSIDRKEVKIGTEIDFNLKFIQTIPIDIAEYEYNINPFEIFYRKEVDINPLSTFLNHVNFLKVFLMDMFNIEKAKFESQVNLIILETYKFKSKTKTMDYKNFNLDNFSGPYVPYICDFVEIAKEFSMESSNDSNKEKSDFYVELYEFIINQYNAMKQNKNWLRRFDKTDETIKKADSSDLTNNNLRLVFKGLMQGTTIVKDHRLFLMLIMNILNILIFEREISKGNNENQAGVFFVVDEAHRYFKKDFLFMIDFLSSIAKQGRKRAIELAVISQNVTDFYRQSDSLDIKQKASDIVKNAAYKFIFQIAQDFEETIDFIQPGDKLTDEELRYIKSLTKGSAYFVQGPYQRTKLFVTRDEKLNK